MNTLNDFALISFSSFMCCHLIIASQETPPATLFHGLLISISLMNKCLSSHFVLKLLNYKHILHEIILGVGHRNGAAKRAGALLCILHSLISTTVLSDANYIH